MALSLDVTAEVASILSGDWNARTGRVVPTTSSIVSAGGRVDMNAALLYADLADSTRLAMEYPLVAAKLFKAYLASAARIIRWQGGDIRSFDGDRIMAVFAGDHPRTDAVQAALAINWAFNTVTAPAFNQAFPQIFGLLGPHSLNHAIGIDYSSMHVVRAGIRDNSDLVWVGRAPNVAAKLSGIREEGYSIYITDDVYSCMAETAKFTQHQDTQVNMWELRSWTNGTLPILYRCAWWRRP